nr:filamentous hemagglutinin N-terminal domain-containing protein [Calothrix sp. FACHB-1219]
MAKAQIIPDNTLGAESSVVNPDTIKGIPSDRIDGGAIRGANLFHSFSEFNIDSGRGAYFTNPSGIENILTRVTGNNASQILGTLGVLGNANLFLINPNGIIFGKDAVLDIRGSFTATTADGIKFGENGLFSATNPQSSNLLTVKPGALFSNALSNQQGTINNQGNLTVDAGKNINLFGANVINTGTLTAPEGTVQLTGTENLITRGNIATDTLFLNTKNLTIGENNNATVDKTTLEGLSGNTNLILQGTNDITVDALTNSTLNLADGSGKIAFIADADRDGIGNFQMDTADTIKTNGRNVEITGVNLTVGNIDSSDKFGGGNIRLTATGGDITTQNLDSFSDSGSGNVISGDTLAIGFGGAIAPLGESMSVNTISSNAHVNGGSIYIDASGDITSEKIRSYISNSSDNNIDKSSGDISLVSGGKVLINSGLRSDSYEVTNGNAGDIFIKAESDITINPNNQYLEFGSVNASTFASSLDNHIGNSGNIQLTSLNGNITVNGGIYTNSTNYSSGNAGNGGAISLTSVGSITTGELNSSSYSFSFFRLPDLFSSSFSEIQSSGNAGFSEIQSSGNAGDGGAIALTTTGANISTGEINSSSKSNSGNAGSGGAITLTTTGANISTGEINSSSKSDLGNTGHGGAITLTTTQGNISTLMLNSSSFSRLGNTRDGGAIAGDGGTIALTTTQGDISTLYLKSNSFSLSGNAGDGGAIALTTTQGNISTQYLDSSSFSRLGNTRDGGAITLTTTQGNISTEFLNSSSDSRSGNAGSGGALVAGFGGAIALTTTFLNSSSDSRSGNAGSGGAITLTTTQGNISIQDFDSYSYSASGNAGNGGRITVRAIDGNIYENPKTQLTYALGDIEFIDITPVMEDMVIINSDKSAVGELGRSNQNIRSIATLSSFSISTNGNSGKGGNVTLEAKNQITNLGILTLSTADKSGDVQVNSIGDLSLINTNIITSKQVTIPDPLTPSFTLTLDIGAVGQSGNVDITSTGNLTFKDSRIESDTKGDNPAGNVTITSPGTVAFNNSKIVSNTSSIGNAGNIQINANNLTLTDTSEISANTTANGKAGDITLNTPTLTLANGGKIFATTTGNGNGGTITVNAPNLVNLGIGVQDFAPILTVETSGAGKAGDIIVNTPSLTVSDTARITATATATATNTKGGGSITLNASKLDLAGIVGIFAETQGQAPAGTLKLNPYQNQPNLDITLFPNSTISASTSGSGKGGDLILTAPENINITGKGKLAVESTGIGDAGNILITTQNLNINDGVKISASTMNGQGGNININAHTLTANNGGQFLTTTSGTKKAGNINIQVRDNITLDGKNTGLFANTEKGATGDSGNITIDPEIFMIKNGAGIGVNSNGSGKGGNISLTAGTLTLDNQAFINAATTSNNGGEIKLDIQDFLFLRRNSNITATAGTDFAGGNGGNITINSPFIIAIAAENSDITANAFSGQGGNINISTQGIFGIGFQAQQTAQSGITASSELGISGNVTINTPEVDPSKGLVQLSANLVDASRQIDNSCQAGSKQSASSFTITGRGGLPFNPYEYLQTDSVVKKWVSVDNHPNSPSNSQGSMKDNPSLPEIVEAQGLIKGENGDIYLVAQASQVIPHSPTLTAATCASSR